MRNILNETALLLQENKFFDKNSIKNERNTKHWSVHELMSFNNSTNECNHCNKNSNSREIFEHQPNQPELHLKLNHLNENKRFDKNSITNESNTKHWSVCELMSFNNPTNERNRCTRHSNSREICEHQPKQRELHLKLKHLDFNLKVLIPLSRFPSISVSLGRDVIDDCLIIIVTTGMEV